MYKGYKIRIYPTKQQEELLWKHIYTCRFVWNYMLAYQEENYKNDGKYMSAYGMIKLLPILKTQKEYKWLKDVSAFSLQQVCRDLNDAYTLYFNKNGGHPHFKSRKKSKNSYPVRFDNINFNKDYVFIEKIKKVKIKKAITISSKICCPQIYYQNKKWILSFSIECEKQASLLSDNPMGIDLGIKELAVVSYGNEKLTFHNINKSKRVLKLEQKYKHIQRVINRKYRTNGSYKKTNNILKYEAIAAEIQYKLKCIRQNNIHQITHRLITLSPYVVIMEDLNVQEMIKNKYMANQLRKQCFSEFIRQMKYKCEWNGIEFIQANRYYPSSKTCSNCGNIKINLQLSQRIYCCDKCGFKIDRDYNAAINLMKYISHK